MYTIELNNPSLEKVKEAVESLQTLMGHEYPYQKIMVEFESPVKVTHDNYKIKTLKKMAVKFFISSLGNFCYTFHNRRGYPVHSIDFQKIRRLSIYDREAMNDKEQRKIESILRRRHPNAWSNLTPENVRNLNPVVINIRRKFDPQVIEQLKAAFDNRTNFRYERCGIRRDWRVETKLCDDGVFRAWFSSEFSGMLNGSYYLLINPTTAAFKEDD